MDSTKIAVRCPIQKLARFEALYERCNDGVGFVTADRLVEKAIDLAIDRYCPECESERKLEKCGHQKSERF